MVETVTARANRAEEVRQERRKKAGSTTVPGIKLGVDESKLDRDNFEYRWAKDHGGRMSHLHNEDWDPAPENAVPGNEGAGTVGSKTGGSDENGKPYQMILMRKRKGWYADDQKAKQKPLDEIDESIRRGTTHKEPELAGGVAYTPGTNTVSR